MCLSGLTCPHGCIMCLSGLTCPRGCIMCLSGLTCPHGCIMCEWIDMSSWLTTVVLVR